MKVCAWLTAALSEQRRGQARNSIDRHHGPPVSYPLRHSGGPAATTGRMRRTSRGHPSSPTTRSTSTSPAGIGPATCTPNASSADGVDPHANHLQRLDRRAARPRHAFGTSPRPSRRPPVPAGARRDRGSRIAAASRAGTSAATVAGYGRPARRPRRRDADDQRGVIAAGLPDRTLRPRPAPPRAPRRCRRPGPPRGRCRMRRRAMRRAGVRAATDARTRAASSGGARQRRVVTRERRPRPVTRIAVGGRSGRGHMAHRAGRRSDSGEAIRADSDALSSWRPRWRRDRTAGTDVPTIVRRVGVRQVVDIAEQEELAVARRQLGKGAPDQPRQLGVGDRVDRRTAVGGPVEGVRRPSAAAARRGAGVPGTGCGRRRRDRWTARPGPGRSARRRPAPPGTRRG